MTTPPIESPNVFRRLRPPQVLNYLVMTGAGLIVYAMIMFTRGNDVGAILAVMLAAAGVLLRWTGAPVLILLLTGYLLYDPGFYNLIGTIGGSPWFAPRDPGGFNLEDLFLAASLLAYSIGHFRLTSLVHQSMPDEPTARKDRDLANPPRRPIELVHPQELSGLLIAAGICLVVGQLAWTMLVLIERFGRSTETRLSHGQSRMLLVVWVSGVALMATSAALIYLRSLRMTRQEAALVLRDEFFQENRRETDRLQRWRKWFKERVAKRRRSGK
jgi:hypothetical protein